MFSAKAISDFVDAHRDEALACISEILATGSVTGDEEPVSFVFEKWMREAGFDVQRIEAEPHRPNLLAEWFGSKPGKRFIFNGHMDVFPPDPKDPGPYGPFSGKIVDGKVYGRGASDMKGGDCTALMATIFLRRMGFDPKGSVLLSWMCDEERGGGLGVQYLVKKGLLKGDFGICPEPTDGSLRYAHPGILRGYITYKAEPAHVARPYPFGDNALQKAVRAYLALDKINERLEKIKLDDLPSPRLVIAVLNAGEVANVHPSKATFWFDRRIVPGVEGETHDEAIAEIRGALDRLKAEREGYDYELVVTSRRPVLQAPKDDTFTGIVQQAFEEVMGRPVPTLRWEGACDAAWIQQENATDLLVISPAKWDDMAAPDEKLDIEDYLNYIKVFMRTLVLALS